MGSDANAALSVFAHQANLESIWPFRLCLCCLVPKRFSFYLWIKRLISFGLYYFAKSLAYHDKYPICSEGVAVRLAIKTTGSFELSYGDEPLKLPASRKTRALLAYLILSEAKQSRQSLCSLFWETPNDPRAALRWSLTMLRPILNSGGVERLCSDRKDVWLNTEDIDSDQKQLISAVAGQSVADSDSEAIWKLADGVLLEDCELPNQGNFMAWLEGQRAEMTSMAARLAKRFALDPKISSQKRDIWAERWLSKAPFAPDAAYCAVELKRLTSGKVASTELVGLLTERFRAAGVDIPTFEIATTNVDARSELTQPEQQIRFVNSGDGAAIAWASVGDKNNPPLVKAANWLNHLELDWNAPIWSPLFRELSESYRMIRYDERGCGLSEWDVADITFEKFVTDLELVVDAAGLHTFPLLGISQGAAVSIEYAARHPDRVSKLVLFGAYDCGWRHTASPSEVREREAVMVLTETGWGSDNPVYRSLFSRTFMPDANAEELDWFDEFQRQTTSPRNALRFLEAFSTLDVRHRLADIKCPTLVVHSRGDLRIPFTIGRAMASRIPNAKLAGVDSNNHLLLGREPASAEFVNLVRNFVNDT